MTQRLRDFYIDSWYNEKSTYLADIEKLIDYKEILLDNLSYVESLKYNSIKVWEMTGMIDNSELNLVDETLGLAKEWYDRVDIPEFLKLELEKGNSKTFPSLLR